MGILPNFLDSSFFKHPRLRKYTALVNEDLAATYSRDVQKWLLVAPVIGILTGLIITGIAVLVLGIIWAALLPYYLAHHWAIVVGLVAGFFVTGLIMQFRTPDPNQHSTEEIVRSYHEHQGDIDMHPFWWKLLAAVTTVGSGGSAALEGPAIYSGGAIGSWLWTKLRRFGLETRDRRIMLISGAAAGMSAVFRAPLTGIVFALEMPYKDDLAHEALLPSLIASVVAYATLVSIVGAEPLFGFAGSTSFRAIDVCMVGAARRWNRAHRNRLRHHLSPRAYVFHRQQDTAYPQAHDRRTRHRAVRPRVRDDLQRPAHSDRPQL